MRQIARIFGTVLAIAATIATGLPAAAQNTFHLRIECREPARFYLDDSAGRPWAPDGTVVYRNRGERHFVAPRGFELDLPRGVYSLVAERGPEYRPYTATVDGRPGKDVVLDVSVVRWINMNARGWFSGDLHNHRKIAEMPLLLLAEDLNVAPTLADWIWDDKQRGEPPGSVPRLRSVDATHVFSVLDKEIERLKAGPGAVDLVGLYAPVPFNGYLLHPTSDVFAKAAREQGAWVDAEKIVWRDSAALVALGLVDFAGIVYNHFNRQDVELQTDEWGMIPKDRPEYKTPEGMPLWAMDVYYRFLNCGFRLPVSGGSASGVKAAPLGYDRVYAKVDGAFSYDAWFRALKAGRSMATNGPMLFLSVDGREPGDVLRIAPGRSRKLAVHAEVSSDKPLDRLEVVFNGRTIRAVRGAGALKLDFEAETSAGWFAARAFEKPDRTVRFAHTSPVYVEAPGQSGTVPEDAQFFIQWIDRETDFYRTAPGFREPAHRREMLAMFAAARSVYANIAAGNRQRSSAATVQGRKTN